MKRTLVSIKKTVRVKFRLLVSYLQTNWRLFLISLVIGLVVIYSLPQVSLLASSKKTPTIGLVGNETLSTLPLSLQKEISFGLTTLTADGQATAGAATSWETSSDAKTITFNLDKTLFWQDGTKFDTSQINYNLKGVEVKRVSLYSLQFIFKEPFAPLPAIVSQPLFKSGLVGLGDNKIESIKFNGRFLSVLSLQNIQTGDHKVYKFFPTEQIAISALKLGIVNEVRGLHSTYGLDTDPKYKIIPLIAPNTVATVFLNLRKELLSEKTIRQSLAYALPDTFTQGETSFSSLPQNSWAASESIKKYVQNVPLAKEDVRKISSISGQLKISLLTSQALLPTAEIIAKSWQDVGIKTTIETTETIPGNFDAYLTYLSLPSDPDQYALWHSTQTGNISGYRSFKSDRLLEDGRKTFDLKARKDIYSAFEKALTEDLPAIFLYYPKTYTITRN